MDINNEFHKDGKLADVTLVIEDRKILASKTVLSIASPVFCTMFEGDFQEKSKKEITLPGKRYEDFTEFMKCIYPDRMKQINENNVYMVLPLAHEYDVRNMLKRCQKVLLREVKDRPVKDVNHLYQCIHISELYTLEELKEKCIYLASEHTLKELKVARLAHQISDETHLKIIELALRRHELDKEDEHLFRVQNAKQERKFIIDEGRFDFVNFVMNGCFPLNKGTEDIFKALRLIERFRIRIENNPNIKTTLLEKLQAVTGDDMEKHIEELNLLPESVKDFFQNKKCS